MGYNLTGMYIGSQKVRPPSGWTPGADTYVYYSFNNGNLNDGSGNGRNGTWGNSAGTFVQGISGLGIENGNRGIELPVPMISGDFTFSICCYREGTIAPQDLISTSVWTRGRGGFSLHGYGGNSSPNVKFAYMTTAGYDTSCGFQIDQNAWNNIILTRSGDVWTIYKNGVQKWTFTQAITIDQTAMWYIGNGLSDDRHFDGKLDEVILETKVWTQQEITDYVTSLGL